MHAERRAAPQPVPCKFELLTLLPARTLCFRSFLDASFQNLDIGTAHPTLSGMIMPMAATDILNAKSGPGFAYDVLASCCIPSACKQQSCAMSRFTAMPLAHPVSGLT